MESANYQHIAPFKKLRYTITRLQYVVLFDLSSCVPLSHFLKLWMFKSENLRFTTKEAHLCLTAQVATTDSGIGQWGCTTITTDNEMFVKSLRLCSGRQAMDYISESIDFYLGVNECEARLLPVGRGGRLQQQRDADWKTRSDLTNEWVSAFSFGIAWST